MIHNKINLEKKFRDMFYEKRLTIRDFCAKTNMSAQTLYTIFKKNSVDTKHLNKVQEVFDVPIQCRHHDISQTDMYLKSLGFIKNMGFISKINDVEL